MKQEILNDILKKHKEWLSGNGGERAGLRFADLRNADLRYADFQGADLRNADLDYSCWPLWCGSLRVHICERIAKQLIYHAVSTIRFSQHVSVRVKKIVLTKEIIDLANEFHRVNECGKIEYWGEGEKNETDEQNA